MHQIANLAFKEAKAGDVVILAVKSQQMAEVLEERRASNVESRKLVISIVAGIPLSYLQKKLKGVDLVRAMPNNPCLVGHGITALNRESSAARKIFEAVGEVIVVPEKYIDAVTGLSGSGPAFIYLAIEAMTEAGRGLGLDKKVAGKLAVQTVLGSAKTMQMTGRSAKELREMVTSPGGTTIEGLKVLEKRKFSHALAEAIAAATKKAKLISQKWTS